MNQLDNLIVKLANADAARRQSITRYGGYCIATGSTRDVGSIVGAHLFKASVYPQLKCYVDICVPLIHYKHTGANNTLDWVIHNKEDREPVDGIEWLIPQIRKSGFGNQFQDQLGRVLMILYHTGLDYHAENLKIVMENSFD